MYRLLIVEDEPLERDAVTLLVRKHIPRLNNIRTAENGFQALESLRDFIPDIILMDINMPGIDGLETIKRMQEQGVRAKFIIITSYNRFEYAQQAIRLGVEDFLIKPSDIPTIRQTIEKVMDKIDRESDSVDSARRLKEQLTDLQPILKGDLVQLIAGSADKKGLEARFSSLGLSPEESFILIIKCEGDSPVILNRIRLKLRDLKLEYLSDLVHGLIVIVILAKKEDRDYRDLVKTVHSYLMESMSCSCIIGAGTPVSRIEELNTCYLEAQTALNEAIRKNRRICFHSRTRRQPVRISTDSFADLFLEKLLEQNSDFRDLADHLFSELYFIEDDTQQKKELIPFQILIQIRQKLLDRLPYLTLKETVISPDDFVHHKDNRTLRKNLFLNYLEEMKVIISRTGESRQNSVVQKAIDFIRENYHQSISLEDLAEYLKLSTFHVSKVIKKSTGHSFPEILTRYRINEAIRLIEEDQLSIKEISYKVGCNSQHYFSRLFKKYTGSSPSEFKNRSGRK